ncbi:hypothetical protein BU23DRAFT_414040, partial [Bimuria novae-zelandiae CBS 107.79]
VILVEDGVAISHPECHGQGFIPLCRENNHLKVERKVNLWRNIFVLGSPKFMFILDRPIYTSDVSNSISSWIEEASILPSTGMPIDSFRLVLDGNPAFDASTYIVQTLHRDAAWQVAMEKCLHRGLLARRIYKRSKFDEFPRVVQGRSVVSSNFELGELWDAESIVLQYKDRPFAIWESEWGSQLPRAYLCPPPLP